ncbi:hypothetical protein FGG79_05725 [Bacillus sp. BHET2]|uniref:hypothetical protein n=1 Tax=Bacillus sp. BHET2 TaxID=2583818 RepID=UPI00110EEB74|nr:hypothetical protein [Bacillus sp. BHET2]TMU87617.1 hypothetical protein FGG79_05725 [Bacillus sp. BHET2]
MFLVLGCLLLVIVGVFLIARRLAPQSELMNSFKKTNSFRNSIIALTVVSGILFIMNYFVSAGEKWRENAIIQIEDKNGDVELFQGEENKVAIAFEGTPIAKKDYKTSLLVWSQYDDMTIVFKEKGNEENRKQIDLDEGKLVSFNKEAYSVPLTLSFEKAGIWKITIENRGEFIGDIVVEVEK